MPDPKLCSFDQLLARRRQARAAGLAVVQCHGCFDIVHPGHIQYLQFAKAQGDLLIVTVSADTQVSKGVNRPLIPDDLRAASLAALACVDLVYVDPNPTAVETLAALQPDVYVKGREYETNHDPRFLAERETVVRHGGRVIFSSGDVVFSSTALIGAMDGIRQFSDEKISRYRAQHGLTDAAMADAIHRVRGKKIVVVGDYILDRYQHCDATGVASEGPMMSLRPLQCEPFDGGAAVIALHLAGLGALPTLVTSLADDDASAEVVARLLTAGVDVRPLAQRKSLVTKTRFLVDQSKLFKLDDGAVAPLDTASCGDAFDSILQAAAGADGVIFADFGYGFLTTPLLDRLLPALRPRVPVITADVSGRQNTLLRFRDVDLLCPTEREIRTTLNDFSSGLNAAVYGLMQTTRARAAMVTLGKQGLCLFDQYRDTGPNENWDRKLRAAYLPSLSETAVDPLGCGDALLATASAALAAGASLPMAAYLGSMAAAVELRQLGNRPISTTSLLARLDSHSTSSVPVRLAS